MRPSTLKINILSILFVLCGDVYALDTSAQEKTCLEIGFKTKTAAFGNCVLELLERRDSAIAVTDPDDAICRNYGFKPKSNDYANCRLQIDIQRHRNLQQQAISDEQRRQFDAQLAEQKRLRQQRASEALMDYADRLTPKPAPQSNQIITTPGGKIVNCQTVGNVTNCF